MINLAHYNIILGSQSPRRAELLSRLHIPFEVRVIPVDETISATVPVSEHALAIARKKAEAQMAVIQQGEIVITADTVVVYNGQIFGKPESDKEAHTVLSTLQGQMHSVITGVVITSPEKNRGFAVTSHVKLEPMTDEEISYYIAIEQPMDKAGAYGIQDWIGHAKIESITGSYNNIVGLPTAKLYKELSLFLKT